MIKKFPYYLSIFQFERTKGVTLCQSMEPERREYNNPVRSQTTVEAFMEWLSDKLTTVLINAKKDD